MHMQSESQTFADTARRYVENDTDTINDSTSPGKPVNTNSKYVFTTSKLL